MHTSTKTMRITDRSSKGVDLLLKEISKYPILSPDEEFELWIQWKKGNQRAHDKLIKSNMLYVVTKAKDFAGSKAPLEDLIQAGNEGLVKALDRFDGTRGFKLISFATFSIVAEIRKMAYDHMRHKSESLDVPMYEDSSDETVADYIASEPASSADWDMRYDSMLKTMEDGIDKRFYKGAGKLLDDYIKMKEKGLTDCDFMKKHHLNEQQMNRLFDAVREEANKAFSAAA